MFTRRKFIILLFCLLLGVFAFGLYRLMALRFEAGDVFPPYSTLRSDPLGSKALYHAFARLPDFAVSRNFRKLETLTKTPRATIFLLGLSPSALPQLPVEPFEALLQQGHRVVIALRPVRGKACDCPDDAIGANAPPQEATGGKENAPPPDKPDPEQSLAARLDFAINFAGLPDHGGTADLKAQGDGLPQQLKLHSETRFETSAPEWRILYRREADPVIMERPYAAGSLVLVADGFPVSNQGLRSERQSVLLLRLAGGNRRLIFDETHLGVSSRRGVMTLVREFRLAGVLIVLLVLAFLYLWQRSVLFVPRVPTPEPDEAEEGSRMDYHTGLVNLLKRHVPRHELLAVCCDEWLKSLPGRERDSSPEAARVRDELAAFQAQRPRERSLLLGYRKIAAIVAERKYRWK
jgi:hypothetical protein